MTKIIFILQALLLSSLIVTATVSSPNILTGGYTQCIATRGYQPNAAKNAGHRLAMVRIPTGGLRMDSNYCIYDRQKMTIAALCNTAPRNRTVTQEEVQRAIDQLKKDCGTTWFSGYHVVNELTVAVYGVSGGSMSPVNITIPGINGPRRNALEALSLEAKYKRTLHNTVSKVGNTIARALNKKQNDQDPCEDAHVGPEIHTNCKKNGVLDANANCATLGGQSCTTYCEVRRRYYYGQEIHFTEAGSTCALGQSCAKENSWEVSVTQGFSIDSSLTDAKGIFSAGLSYQYSVTKTHGTTDSKTGEGKEGYRGLWIFIPEMIESCGTITTRTAEVVNENNAVIYKCYDPVVSSFQNQCTVSANVDKGGNAKGLTLMSKSRYTLGYLGVSQLHTDQLAVYMNEDGKLAPKEVQPADYQTLYDSCTSDFDHDSVPDCRDDDD